MVGIGDGVPDKSGERREISVNDWAACDIVLQLRCMWDLHFALKEVWLIWQREPGESLEKLGDFGKESLENH